MLWFHRTLQYLLAVTMTVLSGCAVSASDSAPTVAYAEQPIKVIIKFKEIVPPNQPSLLDEMSALSQAKISYDNAMADNAHVYTLLCLANDAGCTQAISRLRTHKNFVYVEVNRRMQHMQSPATTSSKESS